MNDAVAVGLITGGVSMFGYLTTYLVQRKSTATAINTAEQQTKVELAKVEAENERLRKAHREAERQNRQDTYHRMLAVLDRFDNIATGYAPSTEQLEDALSEFFFLSGGIQLYGAEAVKKAMGPVSSLFEQAGVKMTPDNKAESFRDGYLPLREDLNMARGDLVDAMAKDVKAGILDD